MTTIDTSAAEQNPYVDRLDDATIATPAPDHGDPAGARPSSDAPAVGAFRRLSQAIHTPERRDAPAAVAADANARMLQLAIDASRAAIIKTTELVELLSSQALNGVLETATDTFDAAGVITRDYRAPYAAVMVSNPAAGFSPVEDTSTPLGASAQLNGPQFTVPAGVTSLQVSASSDQSTVAVLQEVFPDGTTRDVGNTPSAGSINAVLPVKPGTTYRLRYQNQTAVAQTFLSTSREFIGVGGPTVTIDNGPRQAGPRTRGAGTFVVRAGVAATIPLVGTSLTLYGTPGATVSFVVMARPIPTPLTGPA